MSRKMLVKGRQSLASVHYQTDYRTFSYGLFGLTQNIFLKPPQTVRPFHHTFMAVHGHASGIHQNERRAAPTAHHPLHTIPGDAGTIMGNGTPAADQAIEQRGFAHVGASHQDDLGQGTNGHDTPPTRLGVKRQRGLRIRDSAL